MNDCIGRKKMLVTRIKEVTKQKSEVWLEEEKTFTLYKSELTKYHIKEGQELSEESYQEITTCLLPKRAKLRAMNLLQTKDYTQKQLKDKLLQGGYGEAIAEEAMEYVKSYHYVDDLRFCKNYISYRLEQKSRKKLEMELMQKGVSKEVILQAFNELSENGQTIDEITMITELLEKKKFDKDAADRKEMARMYGFLSRRGFSQDAIQKVLFR